MARIGTFCKVLAFSLFIPCVARAAFFPPVLSPTGVTASTVAVVNGASALTVTAFNSANQLLVTSTGTQTVSGTITANAGTGNFTAVNTANQLLVTSTNTQVQGMTASGGANANNPLKMGVVASSNTPTGVSEAVAGQISDVRGTRMGAIVTTLDCPREQIVKSSITIAASTTETVILSSGAASVFNDLLEVIVLNTSATASRVDFRSGGGPSTGTIDFGVYVPAGETRGKVSAHPWPQTNSASNWTAQSSASVTDIRIYGIYCKSK